jgi:pimeloyl-ACP methyl ester carboxylesterase
MATLNFKRVNVHYRDMGTGEPVVFVHTGPGNSTNWRKVCELLKDSYRLLAIDLYGRGGTDPWSNKSTMQLDDEAKLVMALISTCEDAVHLVGHSYGGAVSIRLALATQERLQSLVLIEPEVYPLLKQIGEEKLFVEPRRVCDNFVDAASKGAKEEAWSRFINYYQGEGTWRSLPSTVRKRFIEMTSTTIAGWLALFSNPTTLEDCRKLKLPTTVFCGECTMESERRLSMIIAKLIPNCGYKIINGAGHLSPITHPEEVATELRDHLQCHTAYPKANQ